MPFDPLEITTFIGLAAAAIWAVLLVYRARIGTQLIVGSVTIIALIIAFLGELFVHNDPCEDQPNLVLNEICSVGRDCGDAGDFVEVFNPTDETANLACYAIRDQRGDGRRVWGNPVLLEGLLGPREVRAWGDRELNFSIRKGGDRVDLRKLIIYPGMIIAMRTLDEREINENAVYSYRSPNGGAWQPSLSEEEFLQQKEIVSFGAPNPEP